MNRKCVGVSVLLTIFGAVLARSAVVSNLSLANPEPIRRQAAAAVAEPPVPESGGLFAFAGSQAASASEVCPLPAPIRSRFAPADIPPEGLTTELTLADGCIVNLAVKPDSSSFEPECEVVVTRVDRPSERQLGRGASFDVEMSERCSDMATQLTVTLPPPQTGAPGEWILASFNPWTRMNVLGKITGQDVVNIDMLWNESNLVW